MRPKSTHRFYVAPDEVRLVRQVGFLTASCGRRTLRTETAVVAAVGIVQYELGDLGMPQSGQFYGR
ncbi:MAG: methyltransferase [candidate division NC10 bacterium]|jgi:hypothetical protein|nr:methyltransferase [candidate division NC10 bacterium]